MSLKIEITKQILSLLNPNHTEKELKLARLSWWVNPRIKDTGGLQLTDAGFQAFENAKITGYKIRFFDTPPEIKSSQMKLWIDRLMDCPFFIGKKDIVVYGNKTAVQLALFAGNLDNFLRAKAQRANSN